MKMIGIDFGVKVKDQVYWNSKTVDEMAKPIPGCKVFFTYRVLYFTYGLPMG
jgi:hypothetical protein